MSIIKKLKEYRKLEKKYENLKNYVEIKADLKSTRNEVCFSYHGYADRVTIDHPRGVLYLSLKEAKVLRDYLNKLF